MWLIMARIIILRHHIHPEVSTMMDPFQFPYHVGIGMVREHWAYCEVCFDFSSIFNTIQPGLLREKLEGAGVDQHMAAWTSDFLTTRLQYVKLKDCVSDVVLCGRGPLRVWCFLPSFSPSTDWTSCTTPWIVTSKSSWHSHCWLCVWGERTGI